MDDLTGFVTVKPALFVSVAFFYLSTSAAHCKTLTTRRGVIKQEMVAIRHCPQRIEESVVATRLVSKLCPQKSTDDAEQQ